MLPTLFGFLYVVFQGKEREIGEISFFWSFLVSTFLKLGLLESPLHLLKNSKKGSFYPSKTTQNQEKLHFQESLSEPSIRMKKSEIFEMSYIQYYIILYKFDTPI